jgi:Glycosyl transferases group 1
MHVVRPQSSTGVWRVGLDATDRVSEQQAVQEVVDSGAREVRVEGNDPWQSPALLQVVTALAKPGRLILVHTPEVGVVTSARCASLRDVRVGALEVPVAAALAKPRAFLAALGSAHAGGLASRLVLAGVRAAGLDAARLRALLEAVALTPGGPGITVLVDGFSSATDVVAEDVTLAILVARGRGVSVQLRDVHELAEPRLCIAQEREIALDRGRGAGFSADELLQPPLAATVARVAGTPADMAHLLAARGRPLRDLPPCVGGSERFSADAVRAPACAPCPRSECRGLAPRHHAAFGRGPRRFWSGFGRRVALYSETVDLFGTYGVGGLANALRDAGCEVSLVVPGGVLPDVDTVVATQFGVAAALLSSDPQRQVVLLDHHMLSEVDALWRAFVPPGQRPEHRGWWPSRLFVVSSFPSFAQLYVAAGVPLEHVTWFPYCVDRTALPAPVNDPTAPILCGGGHARDWRTLERAAAQLEGTPIEVVHPTDQPVQRVGTLRPTGRCLLPEFLPRLARARFTIVNSYADARICTGGTAIVSALALGKPVVATWTPMTRDLLRDGVDSLIVPTGDHRALADAIDRVDRDAALRARLAAGAEEAGRERDVSVLGRWLSQGFPMVAEPLTMLR